MGISSDAMLYFGFPVGDADEPPTFLQDREQNEDGVTETFDDLICEAIGLSSDAPYKERKVAIDACPAEMQSYCSYDWPMYILGIRGCEYRVSRGYTEEITAEKLKVDQEKIDAFKAWCEQHNIEYQEPKWLLCSMYG